MPSLGEWTGWIDKMVQGSATYGGRGDGRPFVGWQEDQLAELLHQKELVVVERAGPLGECGVGGLSETRRHYLTGLGRQILRRRRTA